MANKVEKMFLGYGGADPVTDLSELAERSGLSVQSAGRIIDRLAESNCGLPDLPVVTVSHVTEESLTDHRSACEALQVAMRTVGQKLVDAAMRLEESRCSEDIEEESRVVASQSRILGNIMRQWESSSGLDILRSIGTKTAIAPAPIRQVPDGGDSDIIELI